MVTVSNDSRHLLIEGCGIPAERCFALINGIDRQLFHAPAVKHRRVVFLGRKHVDHARKVAPMASHHPKMKHLDFQELPRMQHEEVANALREALFLSCGHPEGFGALSGSDRLRLPGGGVSRLSRPRLRPASHAGGGIR